MVGGGDRSAGGRRGVGGWGRVESFEDVATTWETHHLILMRRGGERQTDRASELELEKPFILNALCV